MYNPKFQCKNKKDTTTTTMFPSTTYRGRIKTTTSVPRSDKTTTTRFDMPTKYPKKTSIEQHSTYNNDIEKHLFNKPTNSSGTNHLVPPSFHSPCEYPSISNNNHKNIHILTGRSYFSFRNEKASYENSIFIKLFH